MKKFEKVNQSNIFLYHIIEKLIFLQIHNILENPQISNMNSDFVPASTVSQQREAIPYICGLGARFGHERLSEHSTCSDESHKYRLFWCASRQVDN